VNPAESSYKNPWAPLLRGAAWRALAFALIALVAGMFFSSFLDPFTKFSFGEFEINLLSGAFLIFPVSILMLIFASLISEVRPLSDSWFWIRRVIFDFILLFSISNIVGLIILFPRLEELADYLNLSSAGAQIYEGVDAFLPTLVIFLGTGLLLGLRYLLRAIPKGLFQFNFSNLRKDLLLVIGASLLVLAVNFAYDFVLSLIGVKIEPQFVFDEKVFQNFGPLFLFLALVILAPISEEFFFRGYMMRLLAFKNKWLGILLSSFIWSAIHIHLAYFFPIFLFGIVLSLVYLRRNNLLVPILIHMINNGGAFLLIYLTETGVLN
jgi:membrane protease YdiL (CAAX protease family)